VEIDAGGRKAISVRLEPAAGGGAVAVTPKPPQTPVARNDTDGFVPLFNGKDLSDWFIESGEQNSWRVMNGELVAAGPKYSANYWQDQGWLMTKREYSDFILRLQFKQSTSAETSSGGVALRAVPGETVRMSKPEVTYADDTPFQLNVVCGDAPYTLTNAVPTGSLMWSPGAPRLPGTLSGLRKVGEWNDMEIEMRGQALRVVVNGIEVQKVSFDADKPRANPAAALSRTSGCIGLIKRLEEIRYRNIEIKELSPSKVSPNWPGKSEPYIVAKWLFIVPRQGERLISLFSNGRIDSPNGAGRWVKYSDSLMVLRWPGAPAQIGGTWVDICSISADGKSFTATNQRGNPTTGILKYSISDEKAAPAKEPVKPADKLVSGSIWKGQRTYTKQYYNGVSVTYELHIVKRDGNTFTGIKFDNGANRNRADVTGDLNNGTITWKEPAGKATLWIKGRIESDKIKLSIDIHWPGGVVNHYADGELTRR
jgi:hypothetical protein